MICQRQAFSLPEDQIFLNGAYMSPILKTSEDAGIRGLIKKRLPTDIKVSDFFDRVDELRVAYAQLINASDPTRVTIMPAASYGLANVANNLPYNDRKKIILLGGQFPSNYYIWQKIATQRGLEVVTVEKPKEIEGSWTDAILNNIDQDTLVVTMAPLHWGDGTRFDIDAIGKKSRLEGALYVIDGTQSIGAYPYDQGVIKADALIVSAYKWLLGPYGIGFAYYGEAFSNGVPVEESWANRVNSDDFQYLTNYQNQYRSGSRRYEMGEAPDFIKIPMLMDSITQLNEWQPSQIQSYCRSLISPMLYELKNAGYQLNNDTELAAHLFGIRLIKGQKMDVVKEAMTKANISVSYRGEAIRVSPNVYNNSEEVDTLLSVLIDCAKNN